jgi:carboxylesterase
VQLSIEHEIEQSKHAGVTHPENLPYLITPEQPRQQAVMLVHGFSSTPREMRPLAEYLAARNFTVLGIRLPGHGTSPEDLAQKKASEWIAAAQRGYQLLAQQNYRVSCVGLSTGSLVLLQLCQQQQLERLVLLSPFLRLKHPLAPLVGLLKHLIPFQKREITAADRPFYYQRRPLHGIAELNKLRWKTGKELHNITTPTLIIASKGDQTIYPGTAETIFEMLGSREKNIHCYGEDVPHVLTTSDNPEQIDTFERIYNFLLASH